MVHIYTFRHCTVPVCGEHDRRYYVCTRLWQSICIYRSICGIICTICGMNCFIKMVKWPPIIITSGGCLFARCLLVLDCWMMIRHLLHSKFSWTGVLNMPVPVLKVCQPIVWRWSAKCSDKCVVFFKTTSTLQLYVGCEITSNYETCRFSNYNSFYFVNICFCFFFFNQNYCATKCTSHRLFVNWLYWRMAKMQIKCKYLPNEMEKKYFSIGTNVFVH